MTKKFKVKTKYNAVDKFLIFVCKLFKKKPLIINLNEEPIKDNVLYVANHNGAGGPIDYSLFMPDKLMMWGHHAMTENYKRRWNYLYHVFYRQKKHYGVITSFLLATIIGVVSPLAYHMMGILPVYYDMNISKTFKYSLACLKERSLMIFPEDSSEGYLEKPDKFFPGPILLADMYYKKYKKDLPIYPVSSSMERKVIVIGKPLYLQELLKEHTLNECSDVLKDYMNKLYDENICVSAFSLKKTLKRKEKARKREENFRRKIERKTK